MFERINIRLLVSVFVAVVLVCAGLHFYVQWENKRFMSEIGKPAQLAPDPEPANSVSEPAADGTQTPPIEIRTVDFTSGGEVAGGEESALMDGLEDIESSEADGIDSESGFDAAPLMSAFGLPEEVTALFDEAAEDADFQEAEEHLVESYGQSPEVEAIIDKLKAMSGRPIELDELTELFEAWIEVLPESEQESRRSLIEVLTKLYEVKALGGGNAEVNIELRIEGD